MDPYEILGVSKTATEAEIKRRYHELAKKHHPDKLGHLSATERADHEEKFKKITAAYEYLRQPRGGDDAINWGDLWAKLMRDLAAKAAARRAATPCVHEVFYDVSIEDIIANKKRKIRVFLSGQESPIFLKICAREKGPIEITKRIDGAEHIIKINLRVKEHPDYWFDDVFSPPALYTSAEIQWHEYLIGCERQFMIPGDASNGQTIQIPAFSRGPLGPIKIAPDLDLYIVIEIAPPAFETLTDEEKTGASNSFEAVKKFLHEWSERALST